MLNDRKLNIKGKFLYSKAKTRIFLEIHFTGSDYMSQLESIYGGGGGAGGKGGRGFQTKYDQRQLTTVKESLIFNDQTERIVCDICKRPFFRYFTGI